MRIAPYIYINQIIRIYTSSPRQQEPGIAGQAVQKQQQYRINSHSILAKLLLFNFYTRQADDCMRI